MTVFEANRIRNNCYQLTNPTDDDCFVYTEALNYLISETKSPDAMVELGAFYYEHKHYDLALKYYELAAEYDNIYAISDLGYIWYYGRTGEINYEKAFHYFDKARQMGDLVAAYKVADMYQNGYYVEKDPDKYKTIIEELYLKIQDSTWPDDPIPEIYTRLAKIRTEEGNTDEAMRLYDAARAVLSRRIQNHPFFGDRNIMKWLIEDTYKLLPFDADDISLYDLFYVLHEPVKVRFFYDERPFEVASELEKGECSVHFGDRWFHTVDDFFAEAEIDNELLTTLYDELYDFEVM